MFDTVLVPIDRSDTARRAAKFGLELAARCDASVDLLYAERRRGRDHERAAETERDTDHDEAVFREVRALDVAGDPPVETYLTEGRPHKVIDAHVDDHDIDLIVMGRRGRTGLAKHMLGSVTERVLRQVDAPVMTVPTGELRPDTGRTWENLLLTTDGSEIAERAGPHATTLAQQLEATLHLVRVVNLVADAGMFNAGGVSKSYVERFEAAGRDDLAELAEGLDTAGIDTRQTLLNGEVHSELAAFVDEQEVDLLVMASEGQTNLLGQRIGSTTRRVLQTVEQPVLVVPVPD
jgi:nucleotide-binding universal stress UspA family protein